MKLFTASWCKFCKPVKQYIEENGLDVEIMDIDEEVDQVLEYSITRIPALVMPDGTVIVESEVILSQLKEFFNNA